MSDFTFHKIYPQSQTGSCTLTYIIIEVLTILGALIPSEDIRIEGPNSYNQTNANIKPSLHRNKTTLNLTAENTSLQKAKPEVHNIIYDEYKPKEVAR